MGGQLTYHRHLPTLRIGFVVLLVVACLFTGLLGAAAAEPIDVADDGIGDLVYVIPVKQTIEGGLYKFLQRAFNDAISMKARYIVLEINTLGGWATTAEDIGLLIKDSPIPSVAYINGTATSAGAYIALNAGQIVMAPGSTIGSAAVYAGNQEVTDPKLVAYWSGAMKTAAELRQRNGMIAVGMVDKNVVVPMPELGETKHEGQIIALTTEGALAVGYSEQTVNNLQEVLEFIQLPQATVIEFNPSVAEKWASFLVHPVVRTILLLVGIAGIAIELFVPGIGIPGLLGLLGFGLYFFGHYVAGFAGIEDIALFVIGIALMVVEIFVPGFGIFGIAGVIALISGVVLAAYNTEQALFSLGIAVIIAAVVVAIVVKFFKHRGVWNRFVLKDEMKSEEGYYSAPTRSTLVGKIGNTLTPLRPAGTILIDGERVDVVTQGEFILAGKPVVVLSTDGSRVVVKETNSAN